MDPTLQDLVEDFLRMYLQDHGYHWDGHGPARPGPGSPVPMTPLLACLMEASGHCHQKFDSLYGDLLSQSFVGLGHMDGSVGLVGDTLFRDGVNWGRIVAFFSFGGALCVESVKQGLGLSPGPVGRALGEILQRLCGHWVSQNGGWQGLMRWWLQRNDYGVWNIPCTLL